MKIPINQSATIPKYNPIVALKICFKSVDSTLKSKKLGRIVFGDEPYVNATIAIMIAETIKCKFLLFTKR